MQKQIPRLKDNGELVLNKFKTKINNNSFFFFFIYSLDASEGIKSTLSKNKCPYVLKVYPSSNSGTGWVGTIVLLSGLQHKIGK